MTHDAVAQSGNPQRVWTILCAAFGFAILLHLLVAWTVPVDRMLALLRGADPVDFNDVRFLFAELPRLSIAILIGAALGFSGSLIQQMTQNPLTSPLTLGVSSGAWLAMILGTVLIPSVVESHGEWVSLTGAFAALGLVLAIGGIKGLSGLPAILSGMAVNLLFGAIASMILLIDSPYFGHLFVWGAGNLTQMDWGWVMWLWPRVLVTMGLALLALRGLALMRVGSQHASARGLALWPFLLMTATLALFLTAISVTAVGMIGFIGLLGPNLARLLGARRPASELAMSTILGAVLLLCTDAVALELSEHTRDLVPTGAATALIGAPCLVLLARRRLSAHDHQVFLLPTGFKRMSARTIAGLLAALCLALAIAVAVSPDSGGWRINLPDPLSWSFRWPRILSGFAAGVGMAICGVMLQRLIRNPLASPEVLGISGGATFALVAWAAFAGSSIQSASILTAFLGSLTVLVLLLLIGRRHGYAPAAIALVGISIGAMLDAFVSFILATGSADAFAILGWLGGSTYHVAAADAVWLAVSVTVLSIPVMAMSHWLTLLSAGDGIAMARGLSVRWARPLIMANACAFAALVTAFLGPISFVGLLAPHIASVLGARTTRKQTIAAALIGGALMIFSDWLGRTVFFPIQLPAGLIAAQIGGAYFLVLMATARRSRPAQPARR